ncbi:MAG: hypothetical protein KDA75_19305 [Planctomycetaceae bacterium]|nr:hypothetical protein [Planctomycetaceae bacterium]
MRKFAVQRSTGVFAAAVLTVFATGWASAGEEGVVRIADRSQPSVVRITDQVVRGQSPVDLTGTGVQQTSLFQCSPTVECPECCHYGSCQISSGCSTCPCQTYECETYACPMCPSYHDCPECGPCGCGHECPIVGWLLHSLKVAHSVKADLWQSLGLPGHCCCVCHRVKCKRARCKSYRTRGERICKERTYRRERFTNWLSHSKFNYFCNKGVPPCGHYSIVYPVDPWYGDARDAGVYGAEGYGGPMSVPLAPVIRHTFNYGWGVPSSRLTPVSHLATAPAYGYGPPGMYGPYAPYYASAGQAAQAPQTAASQTPAAY